MPVDTPRDSFFKTILSLVFRSELNSKAAWCIRLITFALPALLLLAVINNPWVEPKWLFLDPLTSAEFSGDCCHSYFGAMSNLGILLWASTAAVCLFSAAILILSNHKTSLMWFALTAGLLTGWLAIDDTFMLHENVLPGLGVPQNLVIGIYAVLALAYIFSSWRIILSADFWILGIGGLALVLSIFVDVVIHSAAKHVIYLEDSAKFFGIFCWASFHITTLADRVTQLLKTKRQ